MVPRIFTFESLTNSFKTTTFFKSLEILSNGNQNILRFLIYYLADAVQFPSKLVATVPLVMGGGARAVKHCIKQIVRSEVQFCDVPSNRFQYGFEIMNVLGPSRVWLTSEHVLNSDPNTHRYLMLNCSKKHNQFYTTFKNNMKRDKIAMVRDVLRRYDLSETSNCNLVPPCASNIVEC